LTVNLLAALTTLKSFARVIASQKPMLMMEIMIAQMAQMKKSQVLGIGLKYF
jgi:hypothetical protein